MAIKLYQSMTHNFWETMRYEYYPDSYTDQGLSNLMLFVLFLISYRVIPLIFFSKNSFIFSWHVSATFHRVLTDSWNFTSILSRMTNKIASYFERYQTIKVSVTEHSNFYWMKLRFSFAVLCSNLKIWGRFFSCVACDSNLPDLSYQCRVHDIDEFHLCSDCSKLNIWQCRFALLFIAI